MKRKLLAALFNLALLALLATPALAIVYGEPDGDDHPYVGAIVAYDPNEGYVQWCSGTLISKQVFLTAAHCVTGAFSVYSNFPGYHVLITFDSTINAGSTFYTGTAHAHPNFSDYAGQYGISDPSDVAVIVLDQAPGIPHARLPEAGMLDKLKSNHLLKDTRFTAVGYGTIRETNRTASQGILDNLDRNRGDQGVLSLTGAWLNLSMNLATGNQGTCYGDSGGPHFVHLDGVETDMVASITVTGDYNCKATDKTYRMDTESVRAFLANFVDLPKGNIHRHNLTNQVKMQ